MFARATEVQVQQNQTKPNKTKQQQNNRSPKKTQACFSYVQHIRVTNSHVRMFPLTCRLKARKSLGLFFSWTRISVLADFIENNNKKGLTLIKPIGPPQKTPQKTKKINFHARLNPTRWNPSRMSGGGRGSLDACTSSFYYSQARRRSAPRQCDAGAGRHRDHTCSSRMY